MDWGEDASRWFEMGEHGLESAVMLLEATKWRSTVSRVYFDGYAFVHTAALNAGLHPPARENWGHQRMLGEVLDAVFRKRRSPVWLHKRVRRDLAELQTARVIADYAPRADRPRACEVGDRRRRQTALLRDGRPLMNAFPSHQAPPALRRALAEAWREHDDLVREFGLRHAEKTTPIGSTRFVTVHVARDDANPYALSRAIELLQEDIERRSGLDVTLVPEPLAHESESPAA